MDTIKFAVLGFGHIGRRHGEMILKNKEACLVAIIDSNTSLDLAEYSLNVPCFASLEDFFSSDIDCDVINIATPNGLHAKQALVCLEKGIHVLIEKPLALSKDIAAQVIAKAKDQNKMVFTVMQNRYSSPSIWLKSLSDSGKLGKIYIVQLTCYWNRDMRYYRGNTWHGTKELDGGSLFTQFSHFIDMLHWLFGDIKNIKSKFANFNHTGLTEFEDSGIITFDFELGGIGSLSFSTSVWDKNLESSMTIISENGSIKISGQYMEKVVYSHIKQVGQIPFITSSKSSINHEYVIQDVVDVLKGRKIISPEPEEAVKVIGIIERIYAAGNIKMDT